MLAFIDQIRRSTVARGTVWVFAGTVVARGATFLLLAYLARVFDKDAIGHMSRCLSIALLAGEAAELAVSPTLIRFASERMARCEPVGGVYRFALGVKVASGVALFAVAGLLAPVIADRWFAGEKATSVVVAALAGGLAANLHSFVGAVFISRQMASRNAAFHAVGGVVRAAAAFVVVLALGAGDWRWVTLVMILTPFATLLVSRPLLPAGAFAGPPMGGAARREFLALSATFGVGAALVVVVGRAPVFILADTAETANYFTALNLGLPAFLFIGSYLNVMADRVARCASDADVAHLQRRSLPYLLAVGVALGAGLLFAEPLMALVWSEKYRSAAPAFRAMLVVTALQVIEIPLILRIYYRKKAAYLAAMNLLWAVVSITLAAVWAEPHGAEGVTWALAAGLFASRLAGLFYLLVTMSKPG